MNKQQQEEHDRKTLEEVRKLSAEAADETGRLKEAQAAQKASKATIEALNLRIRRLLTEGPEDYPLFDQAAEKDAPAEPELVDEDWRTLPLTRLQDYGAPIGVIDKIGDQLNLTELGPLCDWQKAGNNLTDLRGVGKRRAEQFEDARDSYFVEPWRTNLDEDGGPIVGGPEGEAADQQKQEAADDA